MRVLYHILYPEGMGDDRFTYEGYLDAFTDLGHIVFALTEKDDINEIFNRVKPDLFVGEGNFLMEDFSRQASLLKSFRKNGGKVVLHGAMSDWLAKEIRRESMIDRYFSEVDTTVEFPDFPPSLFCKMHWLAASRHYHSPVPPNEKYRCDILYVGANLPRKRVAFKNLLLPLRKKYHVKIFGGDWDWLDRYFLHPMAKIDRELNLGGIVSRLRINRQVPINEENIAYSSAKICINITESHPHTPLKLINARTFKIPASGGFEVCDYVPQLREFFAEDEVIMPLTQSEWFEKIDYYLHNETARKVIQEKGTKRAFSNHTFHSRVQQIFKEL